MCSLLIQYAAVLQGDIVKLSGRTSSSTNVYANTQIGCHYGRESETRTSVCGGEGLRIEMNIEGEGYCERRYENK